MALCKYGCGLEGMFIDKGGNTRCSKNVSKCPSIKIKYSKAKLGKSTWNKGLSGTGICKSWNKGKTYIECFGEERATIIIDKHREGIKKSWSTGSRKIDSCVEEVRRDKIRQSINERYRNGWMPKAGRCKKIKYNSNIAGEVLLDGSWELNVAIYLDENNVKWKRNLQRFDYIFQNKNRTYTPDFYLIDSDEFIEVKGYVTELDKIKWSQFPLKLTIWSKRELIERNINTTGKIARIGKRPDC